MESPPLVRRLQRHARLTRRATASGDPGTPPFLILFINSICNLTCEHCFYWQNLNQRDDLTFDEIAALSRDLGPIENLNLSGGEPFIRPDFAEIVRLFITDNGVRQVYVPTNGFFTDKTEEAVRSVLEEDSLQLFACEISLDGTEEYHNEFRGNAQSFQKAMETYDMLAALQEEDPRLRIHSIATATHENMDEIRRLSEYLYRRCPKMDHHNLAIIRGDRKDPSLKGPALDQYRELYEEIRTLWTDREEGRFGGIVEPMLQWAKTQAVERETQVVPCRAGVLSGVVYANGDVSVCELHEPIGNLRQKSFREIWNSDEAKALRARVSNKECWCTTEVFMWPSIAFHAPSLAKSMIGARAWRGPR